MFMDILNENNKIAVWGIGYLGYTTLLRFQQYGIAAKVWAPESHHIHDLQSRKYPGKELQFAWSEIGSVPSLMLDRLEFVESPEFMFSEDVTIHIVALPNRPSDKGKIQKIWDIIAGYFRRYALKGKRIFVLLVSAPVPGDTEQFLHALDSVKKYLYTATAFRSDWVLEDYLYRGHCQAVGGDDDNAGIACEFLNHIGIESFRVGTYHDAEIYHTCSNSLQYLVSAYISQYSLAYPGVDFRNISKSVIKHLNLSRIRPSIGMGGKQMMTGIESTFMGSEYNGLLSILKEAQSFNLSSIISYADFLERRGVKRVGILGITPQPDNVDLALAPSLVLAEALLKNNIKVFVHDPLFSSETINSVLPGVKVLDIDGLTIKNRFCKSDALILMTPHRFYLEFTQRDFDSKISGQVGLVLDNTGAWRHFRLSNGTRYHVIGDGTIDINR